MKTSWFIKTFFSLILSSAFFVQQGDGQIEMNTFDESQYQLLLEQVTPNGLWENRESSIQVRVDPRPVKGTPSSVEKIIFVQADESDLDQNRQLISEFGAVPADIEEDNVCAGTGGLQPPPRPGEKYERQGKPNHCKEIGNFVTIAFALPRLEKVVFFDEKGREAINHQYVVRTIEISSYTLGVYDLIFDLRKEDQWKFIKKRQILMVMS